jgi:hypothetical protein
MSENCANTQLENTISAYHEAGHATVMLHFGGIDVYADLKGTTSSEQLMYARLRCYETLEQAHEAIRSLSAGDIAAERYKNEGHPYDTAGTARDDIKAIKRIQCRYRISDAMILTLKAEAENIVTQEWSTVDQIAKTILADGHFGPANE